MACLVRQIGQGDGTSVAQKIQALLIDDVDGTKADGTVRFGLDGTEYEIDLNAGHARALPEALARYVSAARRARGGAGGTSAADAGRRAEHHRGPRAGQSAGHRRAGPRAVPAELVVKFKAATQEQSPGYSRRRYYGASLT
jgi:Lsr2